MAMAMQRVDDRHKLSLPLFYPHYKSGCLNFRSSKDVQFLEASPRSSRSSQSTQRSNHETTRQHSDSNPNRPTETSLKSCLRKSSEKHTKNKDNNFKDADNDAKNGHLKETDSDRKQVNCFKHTDCDVHLYAATTGDNTSGFPTKKWRATKVDTSSDDSKENREHVKMKGCGYTRFRYPLRFHYGSSVQQSRSGVISAIPAGLRTSSFYSNLPRRQRLVVPGSLSNEKNRKGKDEKQRREKEQSPGEKTETVVENDRNSGAASPERELNGVYHVVHEAEPAKEHDTKAEKKHRSRITREDRSRTTRNQSDDDNDDDDEVPEVKVKDIDEAESSRRSSRSSQPDRSEESIKEAGSSSEKEKLKNDDGSSDDDDDVDLRRGRQVEKRKNKKKRKKDSGRDKIETEYAADFDDDKSETLSRD